MLLTDPGGHRWTRTLTTRRPRPQPRSTPRPSTVIRTEGPGRQRVRVDPGSSELARSSVAVADHRARPRGSGGRARLQLDARPRPTRRATSISVLPDPNDGLQRFAEQQQQQHCQPWTRPPSSRASSWSSTARELADRVRDAELKLSVAARRSTATQVGQTYVVDDRGERRTRSREPRPSLVRPARSTAAGYDSVRSLLQLTGDIDSQLAVDDPASSARVSSSAWPRQRRRLGRHSIR